MQGWAGFATLCVGLGVTAFAFHPGLGSGGGDLADMIRRPAAPEPSLGEIAQAPALRTRTFSPQSPLFTPVAPAAAAAQLATGAAARGGAAVTVAAIQPIATVPLQPWSTVVTSADESVRARTSRPEGAEARAELARDLQRELKRLGCYDGEIDGSWGGGSKRAMSNFIESVNSTLPVEQPDYILLTLLKGHRDPACGAGCPGQQVMSEGRCQPKGLVAQVARKSRSNASAAARVAAGPIVVVEQDRAALRPARAAPAATVTAPQEHVAQTSNPVRAVPPVVATLESGVRPRMVVPAQSPPAVVALAEVEPLPGRMTIGGPVPQTEVPRAPVSAGVEERAAAPLPPRDNRSAHRGPPQPSRTVRVSPPAVHHAPRREYYASAGGGASRQRAMVYNLFQRPSAN